ncbi:unnamed protein product [Cylicocyclus nassatus]|uniref:Uncharacterized protein n=1 Tax=Cylicocyclus nassatus TaxID=53992 RepID=A0AA36ME53_CYLNA|nr:unnamed protein product [Cylicocyclus nassatus]
MTSRINYGPRLDCFKSASSLQEAQLRDELNTIEKSMSGISGNTFSSEISKEETSQRSSRTGRSAQESSDFTIPDASRETRLFRLLHCQIKYVKRLIRFMSLSRMSLVRVLVDAHRALDTIEELLEKTEKEISLALNSLEYRIVSEDSYSTAHIMNVYEILQPILQRFAALQELRSGLFPLKEKVPRNDGTTNLLKINANAVKQLTDQLNRLDLLHYSRQEQTLSGVTTTELSVLVAEIATAMSSLRHSLDVMDKFLYKSQAWHKLKLELNLQTSGIERFFLNQCPPVTLNEYLKNKCPSSAQTSAETTTSKAVRHASQQCSASKTSQGIRLQPWTSTSTLSTIRTSCVSTSEVLSGKMTSDIIRSYAPTLQDNDEVNVDPGITRKLLRDVSKPKEYNTGRSSAETLSDYSSFEEAELNPSSKKTLKKKHRGEYVALSELGLEETLSPEREDLHTALTCESQDHVNANGNNTTSDALLMTAAGDTPYSGRNSDTYAENTF